MVAIICGFYCLLSVLIIWKALIHDSTYCNNMINDIGYLRAFIVLLSWIITSPIIFITGMFKALLDELH